MWCYITYYNISLRLDLFGVLPKITNIVLELEAVLNNI
jgi:hypothetical protein